MGWLRKILRWLLDLLRRLFDMSTAAPTTAPPTTASPTTLAPTTEIPQVHETDFSEYGLGVPGDWTERWGTWTTKSVQANADADTMGSKELALDGPINDRVAYSWDDIGSVTDVDVLMKFRSASVGQYDVIIHVRGSGANGSEQAYNFTLGSTAEVAVRKFVAGASTTLVTAEVDTPIYNNSVYFLRFQVIGTSLKAKFWSLELMEPEEWLLETTDSDISSAGWVGVGDYSGYGFEVDYFGCGVNGESPEFPMSGWTYNLAARYFGGTIPTSVTLSTNINEVRAMGGEFGSDDKYIVGARIYCKTVHSGQIRVAAYSGGTLGTGPDGADLLVDFGKTAGADINQYIYVYCAPVKIPKNQPLWLAVKCDDNDFTVIYQSQFHEGHAGDWSPSYGRFISGGEVSSDEDVAWPDPWPADSGTDSDYWMSAWHLLLNNTTAVPTTAPPTTAPPTTEPPTTLPATTAPPSTFYPSTPAPSTGQPATTPGPTTKPPTTPTAGTTAPPTTAAPTTAQPVTTSGPTTAGPTTVAPSTAVPSTPAPSTVAPTTAAPTTVIPSTVAPTTVAPTTASPSTSPSTTAAPTTVAPSTVSPTTGPPTTVPVSTVPPTTVVPTISLRVYSPIVKTLSLNSIINQD